MADTFIGTGELEAKEAKLKYEIEKEFQKQSQKLIDNARKKIVQALPQIKSEIRHEMLSAFQTIGLTEFYTTFDLHYGKNYDRNVLRNSLNFVIDNDFRPQLSYTDQEFSTDAAKQELRKRFNKNVASDFDTSHSQEFEALDAINDMQFYGTLDSDVDVENWIMDETDQLFTEDIRNLQMRTTSVESKYIYQEAKNSAIEKFLTYYNTTLKPKLEQKYGIKMG